MSRELIEVLVIAAIALVVLSRLYTVLGRRIGSERPQAPPQAQRRPATAPADLPASAPAQPPVAQPRAAREGGVGDIARADPGFEPAHFLGGAKAAYEMIVNAFAQGDRAALKPLLNARVFAVYEKAIADREAGGGAGPELVRLKSAEIADAELDGEIAKVAVRFEAELAEGAHGIRETRERWTFERDVSSRDPNWRLAAVAQA